MHFVISIIEMVGLCEKIHHFLNFPKWVRASKTSCLLNAKIAENKTVLSKW